MLVMRRGRQPLRKLAKEFVRLAHADDLLSRLGTLMMRTSPKATLWTAGIMSSGYLSNRLGLPGFTAVEALLAPVLVGGGLLALGLALRFVPAVISARWLTVAEASDLNLMEDYRKSQAVEHLNELWDRVYFYESAIRYGPEERRTEREEMRWLREAVRRRISEWDAGVRERLELRSEAQLEAVVEAILSERALEHNREKSREGFLISSLYALRHSHAQGMEAHATGFHLGLYEDHCDGAYFDRSDTKLAEQYAGSPLLQDIKRAVAFGRKDVLRQLPTTLTSKLWCFLVTRRIAIGVGRAVQFLNEKYKTDAFNSQVLLWPGQEAAPWLEPFPGAAEAVLSLRRSIVRSALGNDYASACTIIDRMFLACFEFATDLRARYDPEYCEGSLDYLTEDTGRSVLNNLVDDLRTRGYRPSTVDRAIAYAEETRREQAELVDRLRAAGHVWLLEDREALRAVRIAWHVNANDVRQAFEARSTDPDTFDERIRATAAEKAVYSRRLTGLRLHHQLAILQLEGYKDLARRLAYEHVG